MIHSSSGARRHARQSSAIARCRALGLRSRANSSAWKLNWPAAKICLAAGGAVLLSACSLIRDWTDPTTVSVRGVPPTLEQLNVSATANAQNLLVGELTQTAGLGNVPLGYRDENWDLVMRAGVYEIGRQCDQYLDVLFRFNREQRAGRQDIAAAAAATGAIMGISGASAKALAITAAAFGLASSLFDASVNSVLFTIEPSALRNVALQGRKKYLDDLQKNNVKISTRPDMLIVLQGYLTQCSPAAIEANINNAASGAPSVSVPDKANPEAAAVLAAPATVLLKPPTELRPPEGPGPRSDGARRQARAERTTKGTVIPPPPVDVQFLAPNRQPGEQQLLKADVMHAQEALGITPDDGDPGELGSPTRKKLADFQRGMNARDARGWPAVSELFTNRATVSTLPNLLPMPQEFKSPFERAYLGNYIINKPAREQLTGVDPNRLSLFLQRYLGVPKEQLQAGPSPQAIGANMAILRDRIAKAQEQRGQQQNGSVSGEKGVLDSTLYDYLKRNPLPKDGSGG